TLRVQLAAQLRRVRLNARAGYAAVDRCADQRCMQLGHFEYTALQVGVEPCLHFKAAAERAYALRQFVLFEYAEDRAEVVASEREIAIDRGTIRADATQFK